MISSFNESVATYVSAKDFKYSDLSKYNMIIVGEIHYTGMGNVYRQLLSKYKFDYLIAEFADMDRSYTREELKEKMDNCTHGSYNYDPSRPCDDQYNYWIYKIAYDFDIPLIGCNPILDKGFKNMDEEDKFRESYMLSTIKEFESKGKCLVQIGDHHLRSIPISKDFLKYCNDTEDDRGIYKHIDDLTVSFASPIWETYKDSNKVMIMRVKEEYENEIAFTRDSINESTNNNELLNLIDICKQLSTYEYILVDENKKIEYNTARINWDNHRTLSSSDFVKCHGGICYDYVNYEVTKVKSKFKTFFTGFVKNNKIEATHTYLLTYIDNYVYWLECSWKPHIGIYKFNSEDEALSYIVNILRRDNMEDFTVEYKPNSSLIGISINDFIGKMIDLPDYKYKTMKNPKCENIYKIKLDNNGNIIEEKSNFLNESSKIKSVTFSNSFKDVKNIADSLTKEELSHICNGTFKNSPFVKYRRVALINKDPAAFIDVYSIPKEMNEDEAAIVCACKKKYRGQGLIRTCYEGLEAAVYKQGIRKLYWETTKTNKASSHLAMSLGFSKGEDINSDDDNYVKILYMTESKYNLQSDRYDPRINEIALLESQDKSVIDKNFKKKTGIEFYLVDTESKEFKDSFPEKLPKRKYENHGIGALVKGTNEYAGFVEIAPKWILEEKWHGNLLYSLYIPKKFRGYGLSNILVKEAINKYDANMLWVDTDNEVAINLYKKFGFKIVDHMKDKDNEDAYIMVRSTARQSNNESTLIEQSIQKNKIYYGLTEKEAKQKHLVYKKNGNYTHKGLNTTLSGLKKFVIDNNMQKIITKYTILDRNIFDIDENVYPDKEYDMIAAKLPFEFDITNVHDLNVVPAKRGVKNESMAGAIGSAIVSSIPAETPYEANPKNYYMVQHLKDNVYNYGITSDPVQYSIFSIDPEEGYKVYKTNKNEFKQSYITFKLKDRKKAKEVYDEIVKLYNAGGSLSAVDEIYTMYTRGNHITNEYQLLYDPSVELVRNFDQQIQYESDKLYRYLIGRSDIDLLEQESDALEDGMYSILDPNTIYNLNDLEKWKKSFDGLHHDLKMRSNDMSRERYGFDNMERYYMLKARMLSDAPPTDNLITWYAENDASGEVTHIPPIELATWKEKLAYLRVLEKDGYIFLIDTHSERYIDEYDETNKAIVQKKYNEYLGLPQNKRVLYNTTLANTIGIGNYDIYGKIMVNVDPSGEDTDDVEDDKRVVDVIDIVRNPDNISTIKNIIDPGTLSEIILNGTYEDAYNLNSIILQEKMNMEDGSGELLRPVFVICVYSGSIVAKVFEKAMPDQKYWHTAIGFGPLLDTLYSFNMGHYANKLKGGLSFESLKAYLRDNPKSTCQINCVFLKEGKYNQLKKTLNFYIFNKNRTRYDVINLLMSLFEKGKQNGLNLNQVCSSFVDTLLQSINIDISGKEYSNTAKPDDLRSDTKENKKYFKIYEGLITKYQPSKIVKIIEKMASDPKNNYFNKK